MQKFDLLIVGGGMVGLTLALAVRKLTPMTVAIVDSNPPTDNELSSRERAPDLRVSAINAASAQIFDNLDVWSSIIEHRSQAYDHMHVWDKAGFGKLDFDISDLTQTRDQQSLGHIIENSVIRSVLWQQAQQDSGITFFTQEKLTNIAQGEHEVFATFTTQMPITAKLVVGADGAHSWVRQQLDMPMAFRDYDHHAIVATVKCKQQHQNTAWQVFLPEGPLAFLPLFKDDLCSIVWSTSPEDAQRIKLLSADEVSKELTAASDGKLGVVTVESELASFPLSMRLAHDFVKDKVVLVGDAAHTIHPLAGQGVNLGLLDAASLAELIAKQLQEDSTEDFAKPKMLKAYSRWRRANASDMVIAMEAIKQAFTPQHPAAKAIRAIGMTLFDSVTPIKSLLVKQALGKIGDLPMLASKPIATKNSG